jgi:methylated-DNA-[protein]-cysteine S-methyltransferase
MAQSRRAHIRASTPKEEVFSIFESAVGCVGLVWRGSAVIALFLPDSSERRLRTSLTKRYPTAVEAPPPKRAASTVRLVQSALSGKAVDFGSVEVDLSDVTPFRRRVYEAARNLGWGQTCSYGELAQKLDLPGGARAVGGALGNNPIPLIVPCHRVLASRGALGGFTAPGGVKTKQHLLGLEGQKPKDEPAKRGRIGRRDHELGLAHLRRVDPMLATFIDRIGPFDPRLEKTSDVFEALSRAIVHQQLSGKAAATIWKRFLDLFGGQPSASRALRLQREKLRGAGLSENKVKSVLDLAERVEARLVPPFQDLRRLDDERVIEALTQVRGVGRWTAEMFLMFRLARLDVLPLDDLGIKKGFARVYGLKELPSKEEMSERGAPWAPYRSIASYYLWRAADPVVG